MVKTDLFCTLIVRRHLRLHPVFLHMERVPAMYPLLHLVHIPRAVKNINLMKAIRIGAYAILSHYLIRVILILVKHRNILFGAMDKKMPIILWKKNLLPTDAARHPIL